MLALRLPPSPSPFSPSPAACFLFRLVPCTEPAVHVVLVGDLILRMAKLKKTFQLHLGVSWCVCLLGCVCVGLRVCLYWCAGLSARAWYKENNGFLCKQKTKRISKIKLQLCPESPVSKDANEITRTPPGYRPLPFVLLFARCAPRISARKCRRVAHGLAHLARGRSAR